jgi:predicted DNA-binding transcriptional regulator AlpA
MSSTTDNLAERIATVERLTYRIDDIGTAIGVSRRTVEGLRSSGRLPRPDITIGRMPLWLRETIHAWLAQGKG